MVYRYVNIIKIKILNCNYRPYAFTFWPKLDDDGKPTNKPVFDNELMKWMVFAPELAPTTGKLHYQSFVYFYEPKSWKQVSNFFGNSHVEEMSEMATFTDNRTYIVGPYKKGDKEKPYNPEYEEFGEMPQQGARTDLVKVTNSVKEGKSVDEVAMENPVMFHQYGRTLERIEAITLRKQFRTEMCKGIWYWGESGCGKSHKCFENYDPNTMYVKNLNEDWWDGYKGQKIVILNEFRGQISFSNLLALTDKWPTTVKWRGREPVPFLATEIRVSCIHHPKKLFKNLLEEEPWEQFDRRFKCIHLKGVAIKKSQLEMI